MSIVNKTPDEDTTDCFDIFTDNAIDHYMRNFRDSLLLAGSLLMQPETETDGAELWDKTFKKINNLIDVCPDEEKRERIYEWLQKFQDAGVFPEAMGVIICK